MTESFVWKLLDKYFEGPNAKYKLTQHHLQSYSDFIRYKIPTILQDFNGWKNSEVYNGAAVHVRDLPLGANANATRNGNANGNPNARAHVFAGMSIRDLYRCSHDNPTGSSASGMPLPTRFQLRHQVLEYSKLKGKPVRYITPNEARLRNLNYQHELTMEVTIVHHDHMTQRESELPAKQFVRECAEEWYAHYTALLGLFSKETAAAAAAAAATSRPTIATIDEFPILVRTHHTAILHLCAKAATHVTASKAETLAAVEEWTAKAVSKTETCADGFDYVARMLAASWCKHVAVYEDVVLAKLPLMLHSSFCILHNQPDRFLHDVGECPYEKGGYFVIRGKEKVIISQESYQRNIIQTKSVVVLAPSKQIPVTTRIQHTGGSEAIGRDKEEIFEAVITCADDPRPPVVVQMQYKRMNYYNVGGDEEEILDIKKHQINEMRTHLPFQGVYVTIKNRKLEPIVTDVPLFLLFRAIGPTDAKSLTEQLSDRDILECILGYDTSGVQQLVVARRDCRSLCALSAAGAGAGAGAEAVGDTCWYTPDGDGDCAWVSFDKPVTLQKDAVVQLVCERFRHKPVACVVLASHTKGTHVKVRFAAGGSQPPLLPFDAEPQAATIAGVGGGGGHASGVRLKAVVCPCRYARRYSATVMGRTADSVTIAFQTYSPTQQANDPLFYELLLPSIQEGSFAVTNELARDMVRHMVDTDALKSQDAEYSEIRAPGTEDTLGALFRVMFPHLKTTAVATTETAAWKQLLRKKQMFLGYMTKRLLYAYLGIDERHTSRDSYRLRRVQLSGEMLADVFRYEYFQLQNKYKEYIRNGMRHQGQTGDFNLLLLPSVVRTKLFDSMYMTDRIQKSFMGKWGAKVADNSDEKAYCQELIRLSYFGSLSYLRRVHKELPTTSKPGQKKGTSQAIGPRLLHSSQYGMICPLETPDGKNIGEIKHLSTFAFVCPQMRPADTAYIHEIVRRFTTPVHEIGGFYTIRDYHKVIVDGDWAYNCHIRDTVQAKPFAHAQPLPPDVLVRLLRLMRRNGLLTPLVSIAWNIARQEIIINTEEGRVLRPLLIVEHDLLLFADSYHNDPKQKWAWEELLTGRPAPASASASASATARPLFHDLACQYELHEKAPRYRKDTLEETLAVLGMRTGVMEYIDTTEIDTRLISMHLNQLTERNAFYAALLESAAAAAAGTITKSHFADVVGYVDDTTTAHDASTFRLKRDSRQLAAIRRDMRRRRRGTPAAPAKGKPPTQTYQYTHSELHPSLMLGIMGMLIPFPEHSQAPRNQYSCHQSKQALGLYVSSFRKRLDHANHILHYPERPLTGSRYMRYINNERLNYGTNVIVAIMCYSGFNMEDSVLVNKHSVERGLFQSTYYATSEVTEKDSQNDKVYVGRNMEVVRAPQTYSYHPVDSNTQRQGVLPATYLNQPVQENDVLIEAYEDKSEPSGEGRSFTDYKQVAAKGGYVDHIYLSDDVRGRRVAKVTLRNVRVPAIGDKLAARSGQKSTIGALVDEEDMPFIGDFGGGDDSGGGGRANGDFLRGLKPDIILNPHAMPSRMTVGQLLESLSGMIGTRLGRMGDSTPLCSNDTMGTASNPSVTLSKMMGALGLDPYGNQVMYNGSTGEQLAGGIFIGPTYYQRLKQMPVDKYYHRRTGRADMVTRQPVGGRAQGGALKFGEMERDSLLSHGISLFTKEAFNEKSDGFHYRVGTATGDVEPPQLSGKVNPEQYTPVRRSAAFLADGDAGGFREYMANEATDVTDYKSHADVVRNETVRTNIPTSQVNVPFSTRLLTQECEAMGVGMHLLPANRHPTRIRIAK